MKLIYDSDVYRAKAWRVNELARRRYKLNSDIKHGINARRKARVIMKNQQLDMDTEHMYKAMAMGQKLGLNFDLEPNNAGYTLTADGNGRRFFWTGKTPESVFEQAARTLGRELDQRR